MSDLERFCEFFDVNYVPGIIGFSWSRQSFKVRIDGPLRFNISFDKEQFTKLTLKA